MKTSLIFLVLLALLSVFACRKEDPQLTFNVGIEIINLTCFPNDSISLKFRINSVDGTPPYTYKWTNPIIFTGEGPFTMNITGDTRLEVMVVDSNKAKAKFYYEIKKDTIDPLKYDYRNTFIGQYKGTYTRTWIPMRTHIGITDVYNDYIVSVTKPNDFKMLKVLGRDLCFKIKDSTFSSTTYIDIGGKFKQDELRFYDNVIDRIFFIGKKINE